MIDNKKIHGIIDWYRSNNEIVQCIPWKEHLCAPLLDTLGNDVNEIIDYLDKMDVGELTYISGIFEYIYGKWTTEYVWEALEKLKQKIKERGRHGLHRDIEEGER